MNLFAGPYYGEFGHEVLGTGLLRAKARGYDKVIVCSRAARAALYADIATEFRPHSIACVGQCDHATQETEPPQEAVLAYVEADCDRFPMPNCGEAETEARILREGVYHILGRRRAEWAGVIAVHARNRPHQPDRNWPTANWQKLVRWMLDAGKAKRVVCVGTREEARFIDGCEDMRGTALEVQMDIAASARCAVGASSGWMHLASLCGCPHWTWVGDKEHGYVKRRYLDRWNPLRTRVGVLGERTWQPSVDAVRDGLAAFLERLK